MTLDSLPRPEAILLDVGGVLLLPDPNVIEAALGLVGMTVGVDALDRAHYHGAAAMPVDSERAHQPFVERWDDYLLAYVRALDAPDDVLEEATDHVAAAFSSMAAWNRPAPSSKEGLAALVGLGLPVGIVSNADGTVAMMLREHEIAQVGPGPGVDVRCIVDSGEVGVDKPDPRIFRIALDAIDIAAPSTWYIGDTPAIDVVGARRAGLAPIVFDPVGVHAPGEFPTVSSLHEVADLARSARSES